MKKTIEEVAKSESEYLADWEDKDMYIRGFIAGAKYQSEQSEWICVEDELPENANPVIVLYVNELVRIAWYNDKSAGWQGSYNSVTHWQPLPNPPQK